MFATVFTIVLVAVIATCVVGICIIANAIKELGAGVLSIGGIIALLRVVAITALGICLLQGWGDARIIEQWMAGLGIAAIVIGFAIASIEGIRIILMIKNK